MTNKGPKDPEVDKTMGDEKEYITLDEAKLLVADAVKEVTEMIFKDRTLIGINSNKIGTVEKAVDKIEKLVASMNASSKVTMVGIIVTFGAVVLGALM